VHVFCNFLCLLAVNDTLLEISIFIFFPYSEESSEFLLILGIWQGRTLNVVILQNDEIQEEGLHPNLSLYPSSPVSSFQI
jgi:hypothetical protein